MPSKCAQKLPAKTEQAYNNKPPMQRNLMECKTGNTEDVPSDCDWYPQGIGDATDVPGPQVVLLGQRLRSQQNKKSEVLDHAPSKNKNTMSRCLRSRVMDHTMIKNPLSLVNTTTKPCQISRGSY